ncbi:MAG: hypothetical protein M0R06_24005 [Sphaerochaeta sp.]|nr:hypothetical protein [Sphaerochaeta sp.]
MTTKLTMPKGITLISTAYKMGRVLRDEVVVSMTTFVPGRDDITVSFPPKTTLDDVYRIMGYKYTLTSGPTCDRNTASGTVTVRRHYVTTEVSGNVGNGHHQGA